MPEKIKDEYCVYENFAGVAIGFGKIIREEERLVTIRYSEGQLYNPSIWDKKFVKRFDKLGKAVRYYIKNKLLSDKELSVREECSIARDNFPSYFRGKKNYEKRN